MRRLFCLLLFCVLLCGCGNAAESSAPASCGSSAPPVSSTPIPEHAVSSEPPDAPSATNSFGEEENAITREADRLARQLSAGCRNDYERTLAAYDYLLAHTRFDQPIGVDTWRFRGGGKVPDYLELRAQSPLFFGIGSCEDYAAALALLLDRMGIPARYLPGLTISVAGGFVDHAWTVAEVDGVWYHLDPQLEDNIVRDGQLRYRYFLKSDRTMLADHRWGANLLQFGGLSETQAAQIQAEYTPPDCPSDGVAPQPRSLQKTPPQNRAALLEQLRRERAAFEKKHGSLPSLPLDMTPPIFGEEGFGDPRY